MNFLKKYPIIILATLVLANFLPNAYKDIFSKKSISMELDYSPVKEEFIKTTYPKDSNKQFVYTNFEGSETYTEEQFQALFPFTYYFNLIRWKTFPEKFSEFKENTGIIMSSKQFAMIGSNGVDFKETNLYPLFESQSKFSNLSIPDDVFRFNNRMEFFNVENNKIDEEKTQLFTKTLKDKGFVFPMNRIFGNPTTMKVFDAGYFVLDSRNELYQIKMQKAKPFVKHIPTPSLDIKYMNIRENSQREFYGLALSKDKKVYLFMQDEYEFVQLPIDEYDYKKANLIFSTDPIHRHIKIKQKDDHNNKRTMKVYVTNLDYELVAKKELSFDYEMGSFYENTRKFLFPFSLSIKKTGDYAFYPIFENFVVKAFILNLILTLAYLAFILKTKRSIKEHSINAILILSSGIYAILAIIAFSQLFYFRKKA